MRFITRSVHQSQAYNARNIPKFTLVSEKKTSYWYKIKSVKPIFMSTNLGVIYFFCLFGLVFTSTSIDTDLIGLWFKI